jgi:uncharacterized protein
LEIENHPTDQVTADLVAGLSDEVGAGTYDYIATGCIGTDAIRLAIIYKPSKVTPVGDFAVLTSAADPRFRDNLNRPCWRRPSRRSPPEPSSPSPSTT